MNGWYAQLLKPAWAPPAWVFGPVWTVLYIIIAVTFGYAARQFFTGKIPFTVLLPFILNIGFNLLFTPLQFGLRSNLLAAVDIVLVALTLVWLMAVIMPAARWVAWANVPYLAWVLFATVLQLTITVMNTGRPHL